MPDKPILIFPAATVAARAGLEQGFTPSHPRPSKGVQGTRLTARFQLIDVEFGKVQATPDGIDPEQVIVLETIGSVADFQNVVKRIAGMEWLGDFDADVATVDPGFLADGADPSLQKARLFVLASTRTAYTEVLRLWRRWLAAPTDKLERPFGKLAEAFKYLNDVRAWGPKDRVLTAGVARYWEAGLASNDPLIRFETELWCRSSAAQRASAFGRLRAVVSAARGECIKQVAIPDIDYHGVLIELPAAAVRAAVDAFNAGGDTKLLRLTDVKYFAPLGQAAITRIEDGMGFAPSKRPTPTLEPVVAILDGLPLANHVALQGRLVVDDPDDLAAAYEAGEHRHGTAMASLVTHAEYDANEIALGSKVYVRPVMAPGRPGPDNRRWETFPANELAVDLIHRAVRRMFEFDGETPPQAASVKVINLSLGDASQPFDRQLSPWARLLDWLSFRYNVLFVVSAGNHLDDLAMPCPPKSIASMSDTDLRAHTMRAMAQQRMQRRLLSPAESVNALTVGALHAQVASNGSIGNYIDLLRGAQLASPVGTVASGFRRSVKPEILAPGGRRHYAPRLHTETPGTAAFQVTPVAAQPGQLVAACHSAGVSNQHVARASGSSNAAALTTRRAAQAVERLRELRGEAGGEALTDARVAVILKAMLVHGASWDDRYAIFEQAFNGSDSGPRRQRRIKHACAQFLGYGPADFDRGSVCTDQRVIVLGCGELQADQAHVYSVPLPPVLSAQKVKRRLTITLAWFTPINPRHRNYRVADLWFVPPSRDLRVKRTDADHDAVTRGTVQHEVLEGTSAVPITDGDAMPLQINCRADAAARLVSPIPYAVLVSLETAQPLAASIYTQVKSRIDALHARAAVRVAAASQPRS